MVNKQQIIEEEKEETIKQQDNTEKKFLIEDFTGVLLSWLSQSENKQKLDTYITDEGKAYLNGFSERNQTIELIKIETYRKLFDEYKELFEKYKSLKISARKNEAIVDKFERQAGIAPLICKILGFK